MEISPSAHAAALWVGAHMILLLVLSVLVVRQRRQHRVVIGHGDVPELIQAIRAFGNASRISVALIQLPGILSTKYGLPVCRKGRVR